MRVNLDGIPQLEDVEVYAEAVERVEGVRRKLKAVRRERDRVVTAIRHDANHERSPGDRARAHLEGRDPLPQGEKLKERRRELTQELQDLERALMYGERDVSNAATEARALLRPEIKERYLELVERAAGPLEELSAIADAEEAFLAELRRRRFDTIGFPVLKLRWNLRAVVKVVRDYAAAARATAN